MSAALTRRGFLRTGTAALAASVGAACGGGASGRRGLDAGLDAAAARPDASLHDAGPDAGLDATIADECLATEPNILGPFHRDGAPFRTALAGADEPGEPLLVRGVVYGPDCVTPLAGAIVDVWQADDEGRYDNDDAQNPPPPNVFRLRGQMQTDERGRYEYTTIMPGRYLNGDRYRPAHIHYIVTHPLHAPLTTQLYFAGDPYIEGDAFVRDSLVIPLEEAAIGRQGVFDVVLAATTR